jgi:hypothetical protein
VVDVAADAQVRLPLGDPLAPEPDFPVLRTRRGTLNGDALDAVRSVVEAGVRGLDTDRFDVQRPLVWMMIGTTPDDTWLAGLEQLTKSATRPVVVPCCFGAVASEEARSVLRPTTKTTNFTLFSADPTVPAEAAVAALTDVLTTALVRTGHALGAEGSGAEGSVVLPGADELASPVTRVAVPAHKGGVHTDSGRHRD